MNPSNRIKTFKKVLLVYKKSAYQIYFLERKSSLYRQQKKFSQKEIHRFLRAHHSHYATLDVVRNILLKNKIRFSEAIRGWSFDDYEFDLVITVGGDGTFLEAARHIRKRLILGVNSDPQRSLGRFCTALRNNFEKVLGNILVGNYQLTQLNRIRVQGSAGEDVMVLNDILFCHRNPAAMSRYEITVNGISEQHRGSGLWIATAAGSTGAIRSAGGKVLPWQDKRIQYVPRELERWFGTKKYLLGGIVDMRKPLRVRSLMRDGIVYIDGAHICFPFGLSAKATIMQSKYPLNIIQVK